MRPLVCAVCLAILTACAPAGPDVNKAVLSATNMIDIISHVAQDAAAENAAAGVTGQIRPHDPQSLALLAVAIVEARSAIDAARSASGVPAQQAAIDTMRNKVTDAYNAAKGLGIALPALLL